MSIKRSPHADRVLTNLQWQGARNDCGPFTTATIINAFQGKNLAALDLARQMDRPVWRGPFFVVRRVPNWATFPWGIVDVLREHGLQAQWKVLSSTAELEQRLVQGDVLMPIIGSWKPLWAHVMTLVAWSEEQGWGFANTQYEHHQVHWLPDEIFQKQWKAMGRLLVYIIHP